MSTATDFTAQLAASIVEAALAPLADRVPPAILNAARPVLVAAKVEGRQDEYTATLKLLESVDASALLSGPIAGEEQATAGRTGLSINAVDLAYLEQHGVTAEAAAKLEAKYGPLGKALIHRGVQS